MTTDKAFPKAFLPFPFHTSPFATASRRFRKDADEM
jgi:hypothetical protein